MPLGGAGVGTEHAEPRKVGTVESPGPPGRHQRSCLRSPGSSMDPGPHASWVEISSRSSRSHATRPALEAVGPQAVEELGLPVAFGAASPTISPLPNVTTDGPRTLTLQTVDDEHLSLCRSVAMPTGGSLERSADDQLTNAASVVSAASKGPGSDHHAAP